MATPEPLTPSRRLRTAALAERERLQRDLERAERRAAGLRHELAAVDRSAGEIRRRLALLTQLAHDGDEDSALPARALRAVESGAYHEQREAAAPPHGYLRGADIRIAAVRVLASTQNPTAPIHYVSWYRLLLAAGYGVAGRDPQATFLTQIGRSPLVHRAGERGYYALDLDAPRDLSDELARLHHELIALHSGQQTFEEIATVRERRAELTTRYARVESALEEVTSALGIENAGEQRD